MGQNILHCIVWKNTKESEHLTQIPKPHLSTSSVKMVLNTLTKMNLARLIFFKF